MTARTQFTRARVAVRRHPPLHVAVVHPAEAVARAAAAVRRRAAVRAARPRVENPPSGVRQRRGRGIFGLVLPIAALVIGDAVLGAEVRAGTFHFTWLSPTPTWQIVLGRGSAARWSRSSHRPRVRARRLGRRHTDSAGPAVLAAARRSVAYLAIFIAIGCLTRRAAVWSLAFVFLFERLLGRRSPA